MAKKNPLTKGLEARQKSHSKTVDGEATNGRHGRFLIAGHFTSDVQRSLRILAAEEDTTIQALLAEGINMVFAKRGKPEIANASNAAPTPAGVTA